MRDPARIQATLDQLRAAWQHYPEMRLGQLICSAAAIASPTGTSDPFFLEDDLLTAGFRALAGTHHPIPFVPVDRQEQQKSETSED